MNIVYETINHSLYFKDPITQVHINTIEGTWTGVKVKISAKQRKKCIEGHLPEFI